MELNKKENATFSEPSKYIHQFLPCNSCIEIKPDTKIKYRQLELEEENFLGGGNCDIFKFNVSFTIFSYCTNSIAVKIFANLTVIS